MDKRRTSRWTQTWLAACCLFPVLASNVASAGGSVASFGAKQPVTPDDLRPHLRSQEYYTEEWSHGVWSEDGTFRVGVGFIISNFGFGTHNGAVSAQFVTQAGKRVECKVELDDDEWSSSASGFVLQFGKSSLKQLPDGFEIQLRCDKLSMDLVFKDQTPATKPGGGVLRYGKDDGVYSMMFQGPRSQVTGSVEYAGTRTSISGIGYSDHSYIDIAPHDAIRRWFRFKSISSEVSIIMAEQEASSDYRNATNGWLLIANNDGLIIDTARVRFDYDGFIQDKRSAEGYTIPRRVRIAAVEGDINVTGVLNMTKLLEVRDPLANLDAIRRAAARLKTKPRDYYIGCTFELRVKSATMDKTFRGESKYRFVYANP
jgi:predicted secreted hydrolase